ncbi:MAG: PDZ domain-containing protein [Candidatus Cloacimonetes bacterium]|nr:PDZ domain-containing protein [Candidatus Cloacimonadota bacterium]MCF7815282.1 PDZ domain-containing protein [Candidatus Cloacimonadota bacterium]MCF7869419.1 PDZ domain-containing protein [Candidatus Cloacimonadota bacterium]MCF7884813.1 PDZ domain-containing protein [Candidatus Cloacimonadota bacterium]
MNRVLKVMLVVIIFSFSGLFAQDEEVKDLNATMEEVQMEIDAAMEEADLENLTITLTDFDSDSPKMGVFLSNLDFEDIYEMHYDYNYGVYVSGVTENGPAQNAGIMKGDIVMEFDGEKVKFERHLVNLIKSHNIGDEVNVKFFRLGKIYETTLTLNTLQKRDKDVIITKKGEKKKRLPVGDGSGGWLPIWYMPDVTEINTFLADLDFDDETFSEDGFLIHGGGGMGNVGKGWFLGGMGAGYEKKQTTMFDWTCNDTLFFTEPVKRTAKYSIGYGGITLDKRYALSRKFITSIGFMIGWGGTEFVVKQSKSNQGLTNFDFDNPSANMNEYYDYKSKLKLYSDYMLFQPRVAFHWRILDWLSFRAEAAYMVSYSSEGWQAKRNGEKIKLLNAPDTNMDSITFSFGPWFGF